jgi:hypothetical protein
MDLNPDVAAAQEAMDVALGKYNNDINSSDDFELSLL